ncbi:hypothetical protein QTO01_11265 [Vibrio mytili]|uniref:hypothetical protein n=1 Tax=Vibrio mytili TaxID=50718 RepID=UPI002F3E4A91
MTDVTIQESDLASSISGSDGAGVVDVTGITIAGVASIVPDKTDTLSNTDTVTFTITPEANHSINGNAAGTPVDIPVVVAGLA